MLGRLGTRTGLTEEEESELLAGASELCTGLCLAGDLCVDELAGESLGLLAPEAEWETNESDAAG
jgi:hypothetical protein